MITLQRVLLYRIRRRRDQIEREQWAFDASPLKALR